MLLLRAEAMAKRSRGLDSIRLSKSQVSTSGFIFIRMIGLAILVPAVEEVFWRGFLARWLVAEKWEEVPIGKFTVSSFLFVTILFTTAHPEWIAAFVYCSLLNGYLIWKKDLWSCVVAHGVSNLVLGVYVLVTAQYQLW